jgi:hypothetical protein
MNKTPRISKAYTPQAQEHVEQFLILASDIKSLSPDEEMRLIAAMQSQLAARMAALLGA